MNNGQDGTGTGILINPSAVTYKNATVINNICSDDQGSPTQQYGIRITNGADYIVALNHCKNNTACDIYNSVASNTVVYNEVDSIYGETAIDFWTQDNKI